MPRPRSGQTCRSSPCSPVSPRRQHSTPTLARASSQTSPSYRTRRLLIRPYSPCCICKPACTPRALLQFAGKSRSPFMLLMSCVCPYGDLCKTLAEARIPSPGANSPLSLRERARACPVLDTGLRVNPRQSNPIPLAWLSYSKVSYGRARSFVQACGRPFNPFLKPNPG